MTHSFGQSSFRKLIFMLQTPNLHPAEPGTQGADIFISNILLCHSWELVENRLKPRNVGWDWSTRWASAPLWASIASLCHSEVGCAWLLADKAPLICNWVLWISTSWYQANSVTWIIPIHILFLNLSVPIYKIPSVEIFASTDINYPQFQTLFPS